MQAVALTCLTAGEDVHEGGLAGPRHPHEAGQDTRPESPTDASQQLQLALAGNLTHIGQALALHLL